MNEREELLKGKLKKLGLTDSLKSFEKLQTETCDWCKMSYPKGGYKYWKLNLWGTELHIICDDCYSHLKSTEHKI